MGNTLSTERFTLFKPTKHLCVEGFLRMEVDGSPGPAQEAGWLQLKGLAWSNLSAWHVEVVRTDDTAIAIATDGEAVTITGCCVTHLPTIVVSHVDWQPTTANDYFYAIDVFNCGQVTSNGLYVQNCVMDTANDGHIYGIYMATVRSSRFDNIYISQLARKSGDASDDTYGVYLDSQCESNVVRGSVIAPYANAGTVYYSSDNGTNNSLTILQEAA